MPDFASVSHGLNHVQTELNQAGAMLTMLCNDGRSGRFQCEHDTVLTVLSAVLYLVEAANVASQLAFDAYIAEHMAFVPPVSCDEGPFAEKCVFRVVVPGEC